MEMLGKAWLVIEESFHDREKKLVSVINPRRSSSFVAGYVAQSYADRFATFSEKISFKKGQNIAYGIDSCAVTATTIRCGHDPMLNAYFAHKLFLRGDELTFFYRLRRINEDIHSEGIHSETVKVG